MRPRVVLHPKQPFGVEIFLDGLSNIELLKPQDDKGVRDCLETGASILVTHTWSDDFLVPSIQWIAGTGAGYEQYPFELLLKRGIKLTTASGASSIAAAEHFFALLLSLTRGVAAASQNMVKEQWKPAVSDEIYNKNLAIIGLGNIGEEIAVRAQGWGMRVAGLKRRPDSYDGCVDDVRGAESLGALCRWADVLVLCAPGSKKSEPLICAAELELLGAGWLINIGRGSLVDTTALIEALTIGQLRGAGLDVTSPEPLPKNSPLWSSSKVIITAHSAGRSRDYGQRWGQIFLRNLIAFENGGRWVNLVESDLE